MGRVGGLFLTSNNLQSNVYGSYLYGIAPVVATNNLFVATGSNSRGFAYEYGNASSNITFGCLTGNVTLYGAGGLTNVLGYSVPTTGGFAVTPSSNTGP